MLKIKNLIFILAIIVNLIIAQDSQHFIIPMPVDFELADHEFVFDNTVCIDVRTENDQVKKYTELFRDFLTKGGVDLSNHDVKRPNKKHRVIQIQLNQNLDAELGNEGYILEVKKNIIILTANDASGIFNGFQTLQQLFPPDFRKVGNQSSNLVKIRGCYIRDYPRFVWRGLMLDVSRHFFTVDEVKSYIDKMAQYKFNVFHWHLTDDQGWRIEIESLPKLTEIGAWRVERFGRFGEFRSAPVEGEEATYGGFYSHEQIRDIVQYATDRNITIVPEIDIPGHCLAALAAYPEFCTRYEAKSVSPGTRFSEWFDNGEFRMLIENMLNPADEQVYEFLDKIFTEVAELFPGKYIHIGGDECDYNYWESDSTVIKFMLEHNIKNGRELQHYFVGRVQQIISNKNKKMIGWDEIFDSNLAQGTTIMSWRGMRRGIAAANMGYDVVMTPSSYVYLDYTQGDHSVENPIYSDLSLEVAYEFEPVPDDVDSKLILGGQGNLWTEVIPTLPFAFYMTYPRAFALSETFWSPKETKDWNNFIARTENHFKKFDAENLNISKAVYDPIVSVYIEENNLVCELKNSIPDTEIYYTIDNTYPVKFGQKYIMPIIIPEGDLSLRTSTFRNGEPIGRDLIIHRTELVNRVRD